jgi:hypothetical protein
MLNPAIYSAHLKLHPLMVLSTLVVAEHNMGVWGLLLAVPMTVFALDYLIRYPQASVTEVGAKELQKVSCVLLCWGRRLRRRLAGGPTPPPVCGARCGRACDRHPSDPRPPRSRAVCAACLWCICAGDALPRRPGPARTTNWRACESMTLQGASLEGSSCKGLGGSSCCCSVCCWCNPERVL